VSTDSRKGHIGFKCKIAALLKQLEIPEDYGVRRKLSLQAECTHLVSIGKDVFGREQKMSTTAANAWFDMHAAAALNGIELQAVSAYRSIDYQAGIIRGKLDAGQNMEDILRVSTAPGYSEHHSGRALDISMPGFAPLQVAFDHSPAFKWLMNSAAGFGFIPSYPQGNPHGLAYEPWHWCWHSGDD